MPAPHSRDCVHRVSRRTWLKPWRTRNGWLPMQPIVSNMALRLFSEQGSTAWHHVDDRPCRCPFQLGSRVSRVGADLPTRRPAPHREPIPKVFRRHAASIAESPRITQPWPLVRLHLDRQAEKRVGARRWPVTSASSASAGAIQ